MGQVSVYTNKHGLTVVRQENNPTKYRISGLDKLPGFVEIDMQEGNVSAMQRNGIPADALLAIAMDSLSQEQNSIQIRHAINHLSQAIQYLQARQTVGQPTNDNEKPCRQPQ